MPTTTPTVKAQRTAKFGAEVIFSGGDFAQASAAVPGLIVERGLALVHPFDDDLVIAGQGTVALEMLAVQSDLDAMVVAVGGGGFISGVAVATRAMNPEIVIVGVQSTQFPSMAIHLGRWPGPVPGGSSIAEGIAVAAPGRRPPPCTRRHWSTI